MAVVNKRHLREAASTPHFDKVNVDYHKGPEEKDSGHAGDSPTISHEDNTTLYTDVGMSREGEINPRQSKVPNSNAILRLWVQEGGNGMSAFTAIAVRSSKGHIRTFYTPSLGVRPFKTKRHENIGVQSNTPWYSFPDYRNTMHINHGGLKKDFSDIDKIDERFHTLFGRKGAGEDVAEKKTGSKGEQTAMAFNRLFGLSDDSGNFMPASSAYGWKADLDLTTKDSVVGNIKAISLDDESIPSSDQIKMGEYFPTERANQEDGAVSDKLRKKQGDAIRDLITDGGIKVGYYIKTTRNGRGEEKKDYVEAIKLFAHSGADASFIAPLDRYATRLANIQACYYDKDCFTAGDYTDGETLRSDAARKYHKDLRRRLLNRMERIGAIDGMLPITAMQSVDMPKDTDPEQIDNGIYLFPNIIHIIKASLDVTKRQAHLHRGFADHKSLYGLADFDANVKTAASNETTNRENLLDSMSRSGGTTTQSDEDKHEHSMWSDRFEKYMPDIMRAYDFKMSNRKSESSNFLMRGWTYTEISHPVPKGGGLWPKTLVLIPPVDGGKAEELARFNAVIKRLKVSFEERTGNRFKDAPTTPDADQTVINMAQDAIKLRNPKCRNILVAIGPDNDVDVMPIDEVGRFADKFIHKPEDGMKDANGRSLTDYYGFDPGFIKTAAEEEEKAFAEENLKNEKSEASEHALNTLLTKGGNEYTAQKNYQAAMAKFRAAFLTLYAPENDKLGDTSLSRALTSLGEFKFTDYAFPDEDIRMRFGSDGQLYRIYPGNKNNKPTAMPVPADIFAEDSFYMKVIKTLSRAASGNTMTHSSLLPINPRDEIFNQTSGVQVSRERAEKYLAWSKDLIEQVNTMRSKAEFDRIKTVAGISSLRAVLGYAQKIDAESLKARRDFSLSGDEYSVDQSEVSISGGAQPLEQVVIQANTNFQELVQNYFKKQLLAEPAFLAKYKPTDALVNELQGKINNRVVQLQNSLDVQAQAWTDVRLGMRAAIGSDPESIAALRHMEQFDSLPEEKGIVDKIIDDVTNMIDRVWEKFVSVVASTIDAFTNFDRIYKNFTNSFSRAYEAAIKTFFTIFWSDFVDNHFDSHKMKWAKNVIHDVSGEVIGLKHMSASAIERLERQIGGQREDAASPQHELKNAMLSQAVKPVLDIDYLKGMRQSYKEARRKAFFDPKVVVPNTKSGGEYSNDTFIVSYHMDDEEAAERIGYKRSFQDPNNREAFAAWWSMGQDATGHSLGVGVTGANMFTPTRIHGSRSEALNRWNERDHMLLPHQVKFGNDGKELRLEYRLADVGLTVDDVYKSPRERKEASRSSRRRFHAESNRYLSKYNLVGI